jgi:hypothetical protein
MKVKPNTLILDLCVESGELLEVVKRVYPFVKNEHLYGIIYEDEWALEELWFLGNYFHEERIKKFSGTHFQMGIASLDDWTSKSFWEKNQYEWAKPD